MYQDQVVLGDVDRTRSNEVKAIFIIGVNDGSFPNINTDETKTIGMRLIKDFLKQLHGEIEFLNEGYIKITIKSGLADEPPVQTKLLEDEA